MLLGYRGPYLRVHSKELADHPNPPTICCDADALLPREASAALGINDRIVFDLNLNYLRTGFTQAAIVNEYLKIYIHGKHPLLSCRLVLEIFGICRKTWIIAMLFLIDPDPVADLKFS